MNHEYHYCIWNQSFCRCCLGNLHRKVPCSSDDQQWGVGGRMCACWPQQRRSCSPSGLLPRTALQWVHLRCGWHEELCGSKWPNPNQTIEWHGTKGLKKRGIIISRINVFITPLKKTKKAEKEFSNLILEIFTNVHKWCFICLAVN